MLEIYLYFILIFLSLCCWAAKFRSLSPGLQMLGLALLLTILIEGYAAFLMFQNIKNSHVYHLLVPVQYVFLALVFYRELPGAKAKRAVLLSIPFYFLLILTSTLTIQPLAHYNSFAKILKHAFLAVWALLYCHSVFLNHHEKKLPQEPMFWVSMGLLIFSLGNVFVDGFMNYLIQHSMEWAKALYIIITYLGLLLNLTFLLAFLVAIKFRQPQERSSQISSRTLQKK